MASVDTTDHEVFSRWLEAEHRGFHGPTPAPNILAEQLVGEADRRTIGVWDDRAVDPSTPVATLSAWPTELTVSEGRTSTAWAVSAVTVAPTHRRRGIARNLIEGELRIAAKLNMPVAILTVSEATIYGRFGFGPAAFAADYSVSVRRTRWVGNAPGGRVHFVSREQLASSGPTIVERARLSHPGEMSYGGILWDRMIGAVGEADKALKLRFARYDDEFGVAQGFIVYEVTPGEEDFTAGTLHVRLLVTATADAYAGLWRFLFDVDLVSTITTELRPVDEPLQWQVDNARGIRKTAESDHLWVRILDVVTALEARSYGEAGRFGFDVTDPLGYVAGRFVLDVDASGAGNVSRVELVPADTPAVSLSVADLGSLYLGGVSASTLSVAGRIVELREGSAAALDRAFRSPAVPWLSIWF